MPSGKDADRHRLGQPLCYCPCLSAPDLNLAGPSKPSSSYDLHAFSSLYFCDECDAIRCEKCVRMEILTYYCPSCGFEVPAASVRGERTRCARHCFECPRCDHVVNSTIAVKGSDGKESHVLFCQSCKWTSSEQGLAFPKASGVGKAVLEAENTSSETTEFDRLQQHFEQHISNLSSALARPKAASRANRYKPSRHIASAAAGVAAQQGLPGVLPTSEATRWVKDSVFFSRPQDRMNARPPTLLPAAKSEGLDLYTPQLPWRAAETAQDDSVGAAVDPSGMAGLEQMWGTTWQTSPASGFVQDKRSASNHADDMSSSMQPIQRLPLLVKWTKRCSSCNHTLVKPEVKRADPSRERDRDRDRQLYKIKLVASLYVPQVELGNRRRMRTLDAGSSAISKRASMMPLSEGAAVPDIPESRRFSSLLPSDTGKENRRQSLLPLLRGNEESEKLDVPLLAGGFYAFQIAFTNPLEGDIEVHIEPHHLPDPDFAVITMQDRDFKVGRYMEAWELEAEDEEAYGGAAGSRVVSGASTGSQRASVRSRASLGGRPGRTAGVERRGNVTKIPLSVNVSEKTVGKLAFDLHITFTYQAEEEVVDDDLGEARRKGKKVTLQKSFSYAVRIELGRVVPV